MPLNWPLHRKERGSGGFGAKKIETERILCQNGVCHTEGKANEAVKPQREK